MKTVKLKSIAHSLIRSAAAVVLIGAASANAATEAFLEEILVTATKKAGGVDVQDASVAITAYGEEQLDALFVRDLKSLSYSAPSVQLEEIGTTRGTANFSIRGLGINSSIPSIDPTVGVFVDGMYMGVNAGIVMDTFDLEGVEVLRGPQGLLFGRNVTGGAVLMRTTRPGDEFRMNTKVAAETGMNYYASTVMSGPLSDTVGAKFAVYYNDDRGYFENKFDGNDHFGDADTKVLRGALTYTPSETLDFILRYEYGESQGDGPAAQNAALFGQHKNFDFSIDNDGYYDNRWNQAIFETTKDVAFGNGQIVNILGWRDYEGGVVAISTLCRSSVFTPMHYYYRINGPMNCATPAPLAGSVLPPACITLPRISTTANSDLFAGARSIFSGAEYRKATHGPSLVSLISP